MNGCNAEEVLNYIDCNASAYMEEPHDFTADRDLMGYEATHCLPAGLSDACDQRLVAAGEHLWWDYSLFQETLSGKYYPTRGMNV